MSSDSSSSPQQNPTSDSTPTAGFVHANIVKGISKLGGFGLFASGPIHVGEVVSWEYAQLYQEPYDNRPGKKVMTTTQMRQRWPDEKEFDKYMAWCYQVGEDTYLGPIDENDIGITTYQNHSCDPNTWWYDDYTLIARREIHAGEEVTFDYGTCESIPNPEMPECHCGTALCRGNVYPDDYLNPALQERYGNHFVGYLLERQRKAKLEAKQDVGVTTTTVEEKDALLQAKEAQLKKHSPPAIVKPDTAFIEFFDS
jgi:hypothetical protein